MNSAKLVLINTLASYSVTVLGLFLGLFSGRWLLASLGQVDYGLMGVVGAPIVFISFFSGMASTAISRFLAFSIGAGDELETHKWFNTSLSIHILLPGCLVLLGWPIGQWAVTSFFNVPPDRLSTAIWVFRFSLLSSFFNMSIVPYMAMMAAKQRIFELSLFSIGGALVNFCFVFFLTKYKGDVWLLYSGGTVTISIILGTLKAYRARHLFHECEIHLSLWWDKKRLRDVFSFAGWQSFGNFAVILRTQGIAILLNKYFPPQLHPQVNASYTVGNNVANYTMTLSSSLLNAWTPEITASEGKGDRKRVIRHAIKASKFSVFLILMIAIPVFLELDFLLEKWLIHPPAYAAMFCRLTLIYFFIDKLTFGHVPAVNAKGKIAAYQATLGGLLLLAFPLAWGVLALGAQSYSVLYAVIITVAFCSVGRLFFGKYLIGISPWAWGREVLFPCLATVALCLSVGYGLKASFSDSWLSFFLVSGITGVLCLLCGWILILNPTERSFAFQSFVKAFKRIVHHA